MLSNHDKSPVLAITEESFAARANDYMIALDRTQRWPPKAREIRLDDTRLRETPTNDLVTTASDRVESSPRNAEETCINDSMLQDSSPNAKYDRLKDLQDELLTMFELNKKLSEWMSAIEKSAGLEDRISALEVKLNLMTTVDMDNAGDLLTRHTSTSQDTHNAEFQVSTSHDIRLDMVQMQNALEIVRLDISNLRPIVQTSADVGADKHGDDDSKSNENRCVVDEYNSFSLQASVWDATIFLGTGVYKTGGDVSLVFIFLLNLIIQGCFCGVILTNLVSPQVTNQTVEGLRAWRTYEAHSDSYQGPDGVSLVSRLCGGDTTLTVANSQAYQLSLIQNYLPSYGVDDPSFTHFVFQGWLMCFLALIIWFCCCITEWDNTITFFHIFMTMPFSTTSVRADAESFRIQSLGLFHKSLVVLIFIARGGICIVLLYGGTLYLTTLLSESNIMLNAVGLQFVMSLDDLLFEALASKPVKSVIDCAAPYEKKTFLPFRHEIYSVGLGHRSILAPLLIACGCIMAWITRLSPLITDLKNAYLALCDGNQDFVFYLDNANMTRIHFGLPAFVSSSRPTTALQYQGVSEVVHGSLDPLTWTLSLIASQSKYDTLAEMSSAIYVQRGNSCVDGLDPSNAVLKEYPDDEQLRMQNQWKVWPQYLASQLGLHPIKVSHCSDIAQICRNYNRRVNPQREYAFKLMQMVCPLTCGCNSMLSPPFFTLGTCPSACIDLPSASEMQNTDCQDAKPDNSKWEGFSQWVYANADASHFNVAAYEILRPNGGGCATFSAQSKLTEIVTTNRNGVAMYADPNKGSELSSKLLTYLCPETCKCNGRTWTFLTAGHCPDKCSCPFPFREVGRLRADRLTSCQVVYPYVTMVNQTNIFANVTVNEQCCHVMKEFFANTNSALRAHLQGGFTYGYASTVYPAGNNICLPCRNECLQIAWSLNFTGGKQLADYWRETKFSNQLSAQLLCTEHIRLVP